MSLAAGVFVASLVVLLFATAFVTWRLWGSVRSLGRTVADAAVRLEAAAGDLPQTGIEPYTRATPRQKDFT